MRKPIWKWLLFASAAAIFAVILFYSNRLIKKIAQEERQRIEIWAGAITYKTQIINETERFFDSIRIEGIQRGRIFDLRVLFSQKYNRAPGGSIDDVHFRHIKVDDDTPDSNLMPSRVDDYDDSHRVHRFSVDDVHIGSRPFDLERDVVRGKEN